MSENEIAKAVVQAAFEIHVELGPGLLESVYEVTMAHLLTEQGLIVERQKPIPIEFRGKLFTEGFRADIIVNSLVLIELKSVEQLLPVHKKQTQSYIRLTGIRLGLLINFNTALIKNGIVRVVHGLPDDPLS